MSQREFDDDLAVPAAPLAGDWPDVDAVAAAPAPVAEPEPERSDDQDEADPLAAPVFSGEPEPEPEPDDAGDGGFSDRDKLVRVWLDDAGRLIRVRVSPVWFTKLGPKERLEDRFREAFVVAQLPGDDPVERPEPVGPLEELAAMPEEVRAAFDELPELSPELVVAFRAVADELDAEITQALAAEQDAWEREARRVTGRSQGVSVTLDECGRTHSVAFEEKWLDEAQVGSIVTHVQLASDRAQESYRPVPRGGVSDDLLKQQELLGVAITAVLNPRGK